MGPLKKDLFTINLNNIRLFFQKYFIVFFALLLLLPQGVGVRFDPPFNFQIDLPRIFLLLTLFGSCAYIFNRSKKPISLGFFECALYFFGTWWILSSMQSANTTNSFLFAVRFVCLICLYPIAFMTFLRHSNFSQGYIFRILTMILACLIFFGLLEFITQEYLISINYKFSFHNIERFADYGREIKRANGLLLQGPYLFNHELGGMLAVFSGVLLKNLEKNKFFGFILSIGYFIVVIGVESRAGIIAILISFIIWMLFRRNLINILLLGLSLVVAVCIFNARNIGNDIIYIDDITSLPTEILNRNKLDFHYLETKLCGQNSSKFSYFQYHDVCSEIINNYGTLSIRFSGLLLNLANVSNWWLFGYSPGAFLIPMQVHSSAIQYNDPGLILIFLMEGGIPAAAIIILLAFVSIKKGFKKNSSWMMSLGILSWFIFSLSSCAVWPSVPALIMMALLERWNKLRKYDFD